jgi:Domain of unknown function (DUF4915)
MSEPAVQLAASNRSLHASALEAAGAGDLALAERLLRQALLSTNVASILNDLGAIRGRLGMHRDAEMLMRAALVASPGLASARANLAIFARPLPPTRRSGVLASFCNGEAATLGLIDPDTLGFEAVDLLGLLPAQGLTGLCARGDRVYLVLHNLRDGEGVVTSHCALVVDAGSLTIVEQHPMQLGIDVHSLAVRDGVVYAVSTGSDEVLALTLDGDRVVSEEVFWRPDPALDRSDHHHLNAILEWNGGLLVSGFGRKRKSERWSSARGGFIQRIDDGERLVEGIHQPHSLAVVEGELAYCESPARALRTLGGRSFGDLPGYARGVCTMPDGTLFVATSCGRMKSKSTGEITNAAESGVPAGQCAVVRFPAGEAPSGIDVGLHANEIYDLLAWAPPQGR